MTKLKTKLFLEMVERISKYNDRLIKFTNYIDNSSQK